MNFHVIKDPVHGTMQFTTLEDSWIKPFIDSPNFQRLRHIKQLGLGDFIFPGAVHTRFNHSLGCCYVASQIAQKIGLADEERQLVMIACLLHDIGHGPFSHTFEGLFKNNMIRHEDWTTYFLAEYSTPDFFEIYSQKNPRYHLTEEKFSQIAAMIMHQPVTKRVLADIVSSQLDADRLDYLLRDSHFCGVRYGEFDFRWMLHCLAIVGAKEGERLGITHKGIGVVEHYLMARRLMMRNIYHGQKKLAIEFFLVELLAALAKSLQNDKAFAYLEETRLGQFLIAANQLNQSSSDHIQQRKQQFLENHYGHYKELCDYDVFALVRQLAEMPAKHPAIDIAKRLHYRKMPKIVRLDHADLNKIKLHLDEFKHQYPEFQPWQLAFIKTPHQSYSGEDTPILVVNEVDQVKPISEYSIMLNAISDKLEHSIFLCIDHRLADDKRISGLIKQLQSL
jgi:uncharacterized protein